MADQLFRSRRDRVLAGVAGGLAERYGADVSVIRVGWVILAVASGGILALVYLLMAVIVPEAPVGAAGPAGTPGGTWGSSSAWTPGPPGTPGVAGGAEPARTSNRNTSVVIGVGLIVLGAWFLVDRYVAISIDWDVVWPVVVIGIGALLIAGAVRRNSRAG